MLDGHCPRADCNVRYWMVGLVLIAVGTAVAAVAIAADYDLLLPFRPSLASIAWPLRIACITPAWIGIVFCEMCMCVFVLHREKSSRKFV